MGRTMHRVNGGRMQWPATSRAWDWSRSRAGMGERAYHGEEGRVLPRRITRFCARCGTAVDLLLLEDPVHGQVKMYTDSTTQYHLGRLFLCSQECLAVVVKGFGSVEAFEEWALSPASLVGSGVSGWER
jgi:hypothetical protein